MTQRSFSNERYRKDAKIGSTRKSAAKAKPVRKQGTVEAPVNPASSKSSAKPVPKDGIERDWAGLPTSPEIKKWRQLWWVLLLGGLSIIGISYFVPQFRGNEDAAKVSSLIVLALSFAAITIDLVVIRKLRKELMAKVDAKKSGKKQGKAGAAPSATESGKKSSKTDTKSSGKDAS